MLVNISIRGFLVGTIWMPAAECYKPLDYSLTDQQCRTVGKMTLRDHVVRATNDGDFQSCTLALGELVVTTRNGRRTTTRTFPLARFPSIADCLHPDGDDWCPQCEGED